MAQGFTDGTRMVVISGAPTAEESLAILLALDAARRADTPPPGPAPRSAWVSAARREAVGGGPAHTRSDLGRWG